VKIGEFWTKRTRIDFRIYIGQKGDGDGTVQLLYNASGGMQSALDRGSKIPPKWRYILFE